MEGDRNPRDGTAEVAIWRAMPRAERIQAMQGNSYIFVYTSAGNPLTVSVDKILGKNVVTAWLKSRTGEVKDSGKMVTKVNINLCPLYRLWTGLGAAYG